MRRRLILSIMLLALSGCGGRWIVAGRAASSVPNLNAVQVTPAALRLAAETFDSSPYRTVLLNHDINVPVGRLLDVRYRADGLYVVIEVSHLYPRVWQLIREGVLTGLSCGFYPIEVESDYYFEELDESGVQVLKGVLVEVSITSMPADPKARILRWQVE